MLNGETATSYLLVLNAKDMSELARAQVGTIRLRLLKVAARVVVTARRVVFHLASTYPYPVVYREAFERLMARPGPVAGNG